MTDLTPHVHELLLRAKSTSDDADPSTATEKIEKTEKTVNEFLKEAYRIVCASPIYLKICILEDVLTFC
jgi:hypothetical protein